MTESEMDDVREAASSRLVGPLPYLLNLLRVPIAVTIVLVFVLRDFGIPGSMREALRVALLDNWYQLVVIALALTLACAAVRFTGEVIIELVAPEMYDELGLVRRIAQGLPRALALLIGLAVALPMFQIAIDPSAIGEFDDAVARQIGVHHLGGPVALAAGLVYAGIGFAVAFLAKGPHRPGYAMRAPSLFARCGFALLVTAVAGTFVAAVLGVWQPGVAYHAVEKYSTAVVGTVSDDTNAKNNLLKSWVYSVPQSGHPDAFNQRYYAYVQTDPVVSPEVSAGYVFVELVSLFLTCIAVRLAVAVFLDLLVPGLGAGNASARFVRHWLPKLASLSVGLALAVQLFYNYAIAPPPDPYSADIAHFPLSATEAIVLWAIMATYVVIAALASRFSGSDFVGEGRWRDSPSVGRRFVGAARRIAALEPFWTRLIRGLILLSIAIFLFFVLPVRPDIQQVALPQFIGPVSVVLLWGATAAILFFPLAYLSHMTRMPLLAVLVIAAIVYSGFDLNDNHDLSTVAASHAVPLSPDGKTDTRLDFDLKNWIASRADWDQYDHYPIFLVATEGGGMRAAYFTATVLAALQDRCPAFAQHTLAISGVSGGSLGASVFTALAADYAKNTDKPRCILDGGTNPGEIVGRARNAMSADLLSPLLDAALFPDAVQRIIPVPVPSFDRARVLEYAVEKAWTESSPPGCTHCDPDRLEENAMDLYGRPPAFNAVPNLFLNTTETATGTVVPYETVSVARLSTTFRNNAEIDDGHLDCAPPVASAPGDPSSGDTTSDTIEQAYCVRKPANIIETRSLQSDMLGGQDRIKLSTAAIVSARFPYLTPAGTISANGHHYVDGGYFENSGTWLISGLLQNLIGQQFRLQTELRSKRGPPAGDQAAPATKDEQVADVASKARFILIVIQSEPCTRALPGESCEEDADGPNPGWNEVLAPLRALLSTRGSRAEYSYDGLGALTALIEQLRSRWAPDATNKSDTGMMSDVSCDYPVCAVTLRFLNKSGSEIPLTWVLSRAAREHMDNAVDGLERAGVRLKPPAESTTMPGDPKDIDRVLGSYRRVLCVLASRRDVLPKPPVPQTGAPVAKGPERQRRPVSVCTPARSPSAQTAANP